MITKYKFGIKENKEMGYKGIILQDGTQLIFTKNENEFLSLMFPKEKFLKIFKKQIDDKKATHIGVTFNKIEVQAILKGMSELQNGN